MFSISHKSKFIYTCAVGRITISFTSTSADRKSTRLNSSHDQISYAVFCLKKKKRQSAQRTHPETEPADVLRCGAKLCVRPFGLPCSPCDNGRVTGTV